MPSTTYYFLGGDASDVNSYEVFQDGTYVPAQSLPGSADGVFAGGPTMSGGSLSVSFLGVEPGQAPSGTSSFEVAGGSVNVHTLTVGGSTLTADVPLTLTSQTSDYAEIALGAGGVLTSKKGIVWGQGNNAVLVSDPGTLLDFGTSAVAFGNANINYAIFYDGAAIKAGAVTIGGGPGLYGTLSIRGTKMDGSAGQASHANVASLSVGGSAGAPGQNDVVYVQGGGVLTVAGAMSIGTQAGSTSNNNFVQVTGAGSKLVAKSLTVGGEVASVDDCGNWTYKGGSGSFGIDTSGYASVGTTLTLAAGDSSFFDVASGGSLEIGGDAGPKANQALIDNGASLVGHGIVDVGTYQSTSGLFSGTVINNGTIKVQNGTMTIGENVTGSGNAEIDDQSTLELQGAFAAGGTVTFHGGYQTTLRLDDPKGFAGTIAGLALGNTIYLPGNAIQSQYFNSPSNLSLIAHTQISGSNLIITFNNGATQNYNLSGDYSGYTFSVRQMNGFDEALTLQKATPKVTTAIPGAGYGNPYVDSLIQGWAKWNVGQGPITYAFGAQGDVAPEIKQHGSTTYLACGQTVDPWSAQAQADVTQAFADYAAVSGLTFAPASSVASANIVLWATNPGNLNGAATERPDQVSNGHEWAIFNDQNTNLWRYLQPGGDGNTEIVHEIGHALGLAHPVDGGNEPDATTFNDAQNQAVDTVMSYNRGWSGQPPPNPTSYGGQAALGALDIAALQALYGTNSSDHTGDDTYQLPTLNQPGTGWSSIWDAGGTDTITNAGSGAPCTIDLRAAPLTGPNAGGYESYVHGVAGGFTIANGVNIEKAVGGAGSDTLVTGNAGDTLTGGGGDDTFGGAAADWNFDTITDLSRGDTIHIFDANPSHFSYAFTPGSTTLTFSPDTGAATRTITLANAPGDQFAAVSDPQGGEDLFLVTPGSLSLSNPAGGVASEGGTTISGFATASAAGTKVSLYDNGAQVGTTTVNADGTWSATAPLTQGANAVFAIDIAAAGITGTATYTLAAAAPAAPTVAITSLGALTAMAAQTIGGTVDLADAGSTVSLLDNGAAIGSAVADPTGAWSVPVTLPYQGANTLVATDTNDAGSVGISNAITYTLDTIAPTVAIGGAGGLTTQSTQTIAGTGEAGTVVSLLLDGTASAQAGVAPDGTWSAPVGLAGYGTHTIVATDADAAGNVGTSNAVSFDYVPPPAVAVDPTVSLSGRTIATLTGTAADPTGAAITGVELFAGTSDLGAATLNGDGTWSFTHDFGPGFLSGFAATATDSAGLSTTAASSFTLATGAHGRGVGAIESALSADGLSGDTTFFGPRGAVLYTSALQTLADGSQTFTYFGGRYFNDKAFSSFTDTYAAGGTLVTHQEDNNDGSHLIQGFAGGLLFHSVGYDTLTGGGSNERFAFTPGFGADTITDFVAAGPGHDILDLSATRYTRFAQLLAHTSDTQAGAVIALNPHDTITLAGVTKAQFAAHPHDALLHPLVG